MISSLHDVIRARFRQCCHPRALCKYLINTFEPVRDLHGAARWSVLIGAVPPVCCSAIGGLSSTLPVQEIDVTALQTTLSQRLGQWLWAQHPPGPPGPPAPPPGRETYGCALGRCIGVGARGKFSDKHCTATVTTTTTAAHTAAARGCVATSTLHRLSRIFSLMPPPRTRHLVYNVVHDSSTTKFMIQRSSCSTYPLLLYSFVDAL